MNYLLNFIIQILYYRVTILNHRLIHFLNYHFILMLNFNFLQHYLLILYYQFNRINLINQLILNFPIINLSFLYLINYLRLLIILQKHLYFIRHLGYPFLYRLHFYCLFNYHLIDFILIILINFNLP